MNLQTEKIKNTPVFVVDTALLRKNLECLKMVKDASGVKILLALKGFAMHGVAPLIMEYLDGVAASSLNEACLGAEFFKKEVHVYTPAFLDHELEQIVNSADHFVFNSLNQFRTQAPKMRVIASSIEKKIQIGLRVNHGYSEVKVMLYNPCAPGSRFGVWWEDLAKLSDQDWKNIDGLHFHTMCQQGSDVLQRSIAVIHKRVGNYLHKCRFINFGGGHHITRPDYDTDLLIKILKDFRKDFDGEVYLEPGEAIALNTGFLVSSVVDLTYNAGDIAILDTSATAHMPDVIEMPYRPEIIGAALPGQKPYTYKLGGLTCLAGDVIGDYSFDQPLKIGDRLVFTDMAHYTMVKTTQFNGVNLPDIAVIEDKTRNFKVLRSFAYDDYKKMLS